MVERGVEELEGRIRAIFTNLLGMKLNTRERILAFIPEYAAFLINRLKLRNDGTEGTEIYIEACGEDGGEMVSGQRMNKGLASSQ